MKVILTCLHSSPYFRTWWNYMHIYILYAVYIYIYISVCIYLFCRRERHADPPKKSGRIFLLYQKMCNVLKRIQKPFSNFFVWLDFHSKSLGLSQWCIEENFRDHRRCSYYYYINFINYNILILFLQKMSVGQGCFVVSNNTGENSRARRSTIGNLCSLSTWKPVLCSEQTMWLAETDHVLCLSQSHGLLTTEYKFLFTMSKHLIGTLCSLPTCRCSAMLFKSMACYDSSNGLRQTIKKIVPCKINFKYIANKIFITNEYFIPKAIYLCRHFLECKIRRRSIFYFF